MQIETFECEETKSEHPECTDEAIKLMEELGLDGQLGMVRKDDSAIKSRSPYREMTAEEFFVYSVLCPEHTELRRFSAEPIPLRVLQVAAHAKSLGIFTHIKVWHRSSPVVKDPVLVGQIGDDYKSDRKTFILARWGEALDEMPALMKSAILAWKEKMRAGIEAAISEAQAALAHVDSMTLTQMIKRQNEPRFCWW